MSLFISCLFHIQIGSKGLGERRKLKHIAKVLIIFIFFGIGCAHRKNPTLSPHSADRQIADKALVPPSTRQQAVSENKKIGSKFHDEKLDFLKEEEDENKILKIPDPIAKWNKIMFRFNDKLYFWVLKPIARGYKAVVPVPVRVSVKNFFQNLTAPIRIVNSSLQGKWKASGEELIRFFINTTAGIGGLGDPAQGSYWPKTSDEDFGQTLAVYKIGNGFYIVWPFFGPSTLRDTVGMIGDRFLNPLSYISPSEASLGMSGLDVVNSTSFRIGDYEALKKAAIEPYNAFRDAYIQHRIKKINE